MPIHYSRPDFRTLALVFLLAGGVSLLAQDEPVSVNFDRRVGCSLGRSLLFFLGGSGGLQTGARAAGRLPGRLPLLGPSAWIGRGWSITDPRLRAGLSLGSCFPVFRAGERTT